MTNGRHLPASKLSVNVDSGIMKLTSEVEARYLLENTDYSGFSLVVDQVVNLVVAMD